MTLFRTRGRSLVGLATTLLLAGTLSCDSSAQSSSADVEWAFNTTVIEGCSCTMFCPCFFSAKPSHDEAAHGEKGHQCEFNIAFQVNSGRFGGTSLEGAKFWVAGDLGGDFAEGTTEWAVLTFDPAVTPQQREGIQTILGHVYPLEWKSFQIAPDASVEWSASADRAEARLADGQSGEVILNRQGGNTTDPVVIENLKYWGAPRNDGVQLMPSEVQAYRQGPNAFETRGTNGFMLTFEMTSNDL